MNENRSGKMKLL